MPFFKANILMSCYKMSKGAFTTGNSSTLTSSRPVESTKGLLGTWEANCLETRTFQVSASHKTWKSQEKFERRSQLGLSLCMGGGGGEVIL